MKFQSSNTKTIFELEFYGKKRYTCPECNDSRKKKKAKDLQYYPDVNRAYCFHCNTTMFEYKPFNKKEYIAPEWKNITDLSDKAVKWFNSRMIKQETLKEMRIYTDNEWMPQFEKVIEVICFPFFVGKDLINIKFRGANKSFKLNSGSRLLWYNFDAITENENIIICEGEIDCLTFIENGFKNCISVPNGAGNNLEYLDDSIELFKDKTVLLSTDNDAKGIELKEELIRRIGAENCKIIDFKECKDANEYFIRYGGIEFKKVVKEAKNVKIDGNICVDEFRGDLEDLFVNGMQKGMDIDFFEIDQFCTWETKRLCICTGWPGSGKSEIVDFIITKLNRMHGWKAAYFTPENYPVKYHYAKLYEKLIGKQFSSKKSNQIEFDIAYEYIRENFFYILPENDLSVDKILSNAKSYVRSNGIKVLVIDPYNKLDHQIPRSQTETQYISSFLDKLIMFAKLNDVLVFLIAHPVKLDRGQIPTLYNISGSSHFYNKTDYGFTVHRKFDETNKMTNEVEIHWQKIKFKHLGMQGVSEVDYNYNNGRLATNMEWDNTNWLVNNVQSEFNMEPNYDISETINEAPF